MAMALLLAAADGTGQTIAPDFASAASTCHADGERLRAVASFFELAPDQRVAEFEPGFALTPCLADALRGRGKLLLAVDGGDRVAQVVRRVAVQKTLKKDPARYADVPLLLLKPGKPVPPEQAASLDRVVIAGGGDALLDDPGRARGLLRSLADLAKPAALLGIVDVPETDRARVEKLAALLREAGWEPAGEMKTDAAGLLLLKYRKR